MSVNCGSIKCAEKLLARFQSEFREQSAACDLVISTDEREMVSVHKIVIEEFTELFSADVERKLGCILLPSTKFEVLRLVLEFVYFQVLSVAELDDSITTELRETADKWKISGLVQLIDESLGTTHAGNGSDASVVRDLNHFKPNSKAYCCGTYGNLTDIDGSGEPIAKKVRKEPSQLATASSADIDVQLSTSSAVDSSVDYDVAIALPQATPTSLKNAHTTIMSMDNLKKLRLKRNNDQSANQAATPSKQFRSTYPHPCDCPLECKICVRHTIDEIDHASPLVSCLDSPTSPSRPEDRGLVVVRTPRSRPDKNFAIPAIESRTTGLATAAFYGTPIKTLGDSLTAKAVNLLPTPRTPSTATYDDPKMTPTSIAREENLTSTGKKRGRPRKTPVVDEKQQKITKFFSAKTEFPKETDKKSRPSLEGVKKSLHFESDANGGLENSPPSKRV